MSIDENSQFEGSSRRVENPTDPSPSVDAKDAQKKDKQSPAPAPLPSIDAELTVWAEAPEDSTTAVCILPGTELAFSEDVKCASFRLFGYKAEIINFRTAIFRQINKDVPRVHHDALEFPDGTFVLLTDLLEGQEATVLQLPAQPQTPAEEAAQRHVVYVG